jgi:hypothetical protein
MLATMQRMLQKLTRSPSAAQFPHPEWKTPLLLSTKVVNACRPELLAVKEMLSGPRRPVSAAAVQQLKAFLSDSGASPLFGGDPVIARTAAGQLQRSFAEHPEP